MKGFDMEKADMDLLMSASAVLRKCGLMWLDRDNRVKLGGSIPSEPEIITIDQNAFDIASEPQPQLVDPVITSEFTKYFQLIVEGWPPERRGNIADAKESFFKQAGLNKYSKEFIDGFELALNAYSRDDKEKNADKPKYFFKNLSVWIPEWENWLAAYVENTKSGQWVPIEKGSVWAYLRKQKGG